HSYGPIEVSVVYLLSAFLYGCHASAVSVPQLIKTYADSTPRSIRIAFPASGTTQPYVYNSGYRWLLFRHIQPYSQRYEYAAPGYPYVIHRRTGDHQYRTRKHMPVLFQLIGSGSARRRGPVSRKYETQGF